jgi:hypothetical protein
MSSGARYLERLIPDFLIGGSMIAGVLAVAHFLGPFLAGIIAALPVRLGATLFLGGIAGSSEFFLGLLRGIIPANFGTLCFIVMLAKTTRRYGVWKSFALSWAVCIAVTWIGLMII